MEIREALQEAIDYGSVNQRVKTLEECRQDHEDRIRILEKQTTQMDGKLDTIIDQTKTNNATKLSWKLLACTVLGGGIVSMICAVIYEIIK